MELSTASSGPVTCRPVRCRPSSAWVLPEWNTSARVASFTTLPEATHAAEATVSCGTVFFEGPAGPQIGQLMPESRLLGGGGQVVFADGVPADRLRPGDLRVGR